MAYSSGSREKMFPNINYILDILLQQSDGSGDGIDLNDSDFNVGEDDTFEVTRLRVFRK